MARSPEGCEDVKEQIMKWKFILLLLFSGYCQAQVSRICEGNLGENIFTNGDFGIGNANILPDDPMIAPGYRYTRAGPPNDGLYTITNDMSQWFALYETWLPIGDNSGSPSGYMMVVNASFEPGIFYEQVIDNLCENTLYVFSMDVINLIKQNVPDHIRPNVSFLLNDEVQFSTGEIPQNETWQTYGFTFTTEPGQTTMKLTLRNNAPGGIGNDLALDNISFRPCGPEALILPREVANICEDGSPIELTATINGDQFDTPAVQWQESFDEGLTWEDIPGANQPTHLHDKLAAGFYYYRYTVANSPDNLANIKCRIISNTKIVNVVPKLWEITDTLCDGNTFMVGNSVYSQTGIYIDSLISSIGCDSIVTLNLTIVPNLGIQADTEIQPPSCFGFTDAVFSVLQIDNAYPPYQVSLSGNIIEDPPRLAGLGSGDYSLLITDHFNCTLEVPVVIEDPPPFVIDIGQDTAVNLGESLRLSANTNYEVSNFSWTPDDVVCAGDCLNLEWLPTETNLYRLDATSVNECSASDSIFIEVRKIREAFIPNVFSPNGDGVNDFFTAYGNDNLLKNIEQLLIFDRWGQQVYEKTNFLPNLPIEGWDGRSVKGELGTGVYVYLFKLRFVDDVVVNFTGDILLLDN